MVILTTGCHPKETPSCPLGAPIEVDLAAWSRGLQAVAPPSAPPGATGYESLLGELYLEPLPPPADGDAAPADTVMTLRSVETLPVQRGDGHPADRLVVARFASAAGAESVRAQLLRPLAAHQQTYCLLGDDLSHDKETHAVPCLEPHEGPARSLGLERLVAPDRDAIVVHDAGGWCGPGARRGDLFKTSYWGVEGERLVRYLAAVTFESWYESPVPPVEIRRGEIDSPTPGPEHHRDRDRRVSSPDDPSLPSSTARRRERRPSTATSRAVCRRGQHTVFGRRPKRPGSEETPR